MVPSLFYESGVNAETFFQDRFTGDIFQAIEFRPRVLRIDEIDGNRRDSAEVINAAPDKDP
jgi:hypothetical protein